MNLPDAFLVHTVTVHPKAARTGTGTITGPDRTLRGLVQEKTRTVLNSDGTEVVSTATIVTAPGSGVNPGDHVTLPSGRKALVIAVQHANDGGMGAWQHDAVVLQ